MTPFEIDILMHYYVSPEEHEAVLRNPPIWSETRQWFLDQGLLELRPEPSDYGATYIATARAKAWIEHVCNIPLPEQKWVMPE